MSSLGGVVKRSKARRHPDVTHERALLRSGARVVVGMDEVGRGALAGPVSVGVVAMECDTPSPPEGVADSKLLTAHARQRLVEPITRWALAWAVGHAGAAEIDALGIVPALRLAGLRALAQIRRATDHLDVVILDGDVNWLTRPAQMDLFDAMAGDEFDVTLEPRVQLLVKADQQCATVAAASIVAKCERDALMESFATQYPQFGWDSNKGYATATHRQALQEHGQTPLHRRSWNLMGSPKKTLSEQPVFID